MSATYICDGCYNPIPAKATPQAYTIRIGHVIASPVVLVHACSKACIPTAAATAYPAGEPT